MKPENGDYLVCKYLVESSGELLMVLRIWEQCFASKTSKFLVFKLDVSSEPAKWIRVESIGDQMLLLGRNHSKSILAVGFLSFKGNRIYYANDRIVPYQHKEKLRVFCLDECRNKKFLPKNYRSFILPHSLENPHIWTFFDSCNN